MVLTRRALARLKVQNPQATTDTLEVDGENPEVVVCKDAAEGSAEIRTTAEGTVTDTDGAFQQRITTENDQTDRSPSTYSQEESSHRDDDKEKTGDSRTSRPRTSQTSAPFTTTTPEHAPLLSVEGEKPDSDQKHLKQSASSSHATEPIPREAESPTNVEAEPEANDVSKGVGAQDEHKIQIPPSQSEPTLRRSQRARRPTQRYAAGMGNDNGGKGKKGTAKEDSELQKVTTAQGRLKRKRGEPSEPGESSAGNDTDVEEDTRHVRRRAEECVLEPVRSQSEYDWMWWVDYRHIIFGPHEEVPGIGSWNRFTAPRPVSDMREINEERWRALVNVAAEAEKLEE